MYLVLLIVRQQLEADIERLTSDKTDLLLRMQCEKDLKEVNECKNWVFQIANTFTINSVLKMREKAISGMMATAAGREKDERITHMTKVP